MKCKLKIRIYNCHDNKPSSHLFIKYQSDVSGFRNSDLIRLRYERSTLKKLGAFVKNDSTIFIEY